MPTKFCCSLLHQIDTTDFDTDFMTARIAKYISKIVVTAKILANPVAHSKAGINK